jgi:hypothetical protein
MREDGSPASIDLNRAARLLQRKMSRRGRISFRRRNTAPSILTMFAEAVTGIRPWAINKA